MFRKTVRDKSIVTPADESGARGRGREESDKKTRQRLETKQLKHPPHGSVESSSCLLKARKGNHVEGDDLNASLNELMRLFGGHGG